MEYIVSSGKTYMRRLVPLMMVGLALFLVVGCNSGGSSGDPKKDLGAGQNVSAPAGVNDTGSKSHAGASSLPLPATAGSPGETYVNPGGK